MSNSTDKSTSIQGTLDASIKGRLLVIRNDKIGDFMLIWPALALLKQQFPELHITALVPRYTELLARECDWVDDVIIDEPLEKRGEDIAQLTEKIAAGKFDFSISFFSQGRTAIALRRAGVKRRYGPATKLAQLFLNKRLKQRRSRSLKPEYEYNNELARYFIVDQGQLPLPLPQPPYMTFTDAELEHSRTQLREHGIDNQKFIIVHPGTGGSAINLSLEQYAGLCRKLVDATGDTLLITAGPAEADIARKLSSMLHDTYHIVHHSETDIIDFCRIIAQCDLFISGSTGPLHIAGALNCRTAAFYPARRSAIARRWLTINDEANRIYFSPQVYVDDKDMLTINVDRCAAEIIKQFYS